MQDIYIPQNQPDPKGKPYKLIIILLSLLVFGGILVSWIYGHSYISISVNDRVNGEVNYEIVDQKTKTSTSITSAAPNVKKLVKRGAYEVLATKNDTSYFSVVSTKPFLGKTTVSVQLQQEKSRSFVGNNPSPCAYYDQKILISYECDGTWTFASP